MENRQFKQVLVPLRGGIGLFEGNPAGSSPQFGSSAGKAEKEEDACMSSGRLRRKKSSLGIGQTRKGRGIMQKTVLASSAEGGEETQY